MTLVTSVPPLLVAITMVTSLFSPLLSSNHLVSSQALLEKGVVTLVKIPVYVVFSSLHLE